MKESELILISGGGLSASFMNAVSRGIKNILDLGRTVGSAIRRIKTGRFCTI